MDINSEKQNFISFFKKYQYILIVILAGVFLMLLPSKTEAPENQILNNETSLLDLGQELSSILSKISGVGDADVLLTEASGSKTIYQMDSTQNQDNLDTVIIMDDTRKEMGLVKQILPPTYKGAIIVCQGADSASVRLSVIEAVKSVTGLSSDCISVLKMK